MDQLDAKILLLRAILKHANTQTNRILLTHSQTLMNHAHTVTGDK